MELVLLVNRFNVKGRLVTLVPFGNGNINDTFLAVFRNTFTETQLILQRVNRNVFPRPEQIMANMHAITLHCHEKLERDAASGRDDRVWQMPRIIKARDDGADFITDETGEVWRVITRILSALAFDTAQSPEHALECGATLGHFHYLLSDMDPALIVDPLPGCALGNTVTPATLPWMASTAFAAGTGAFSASKWTTSMTAFSSVTFSSIN